MRGRERDFCATARIFFARLLAMCPFVNPPSLSLSSLRSFFRIFPCKTEARSSEQAREGERKRRDWLEPGAERERARAGSSYRGWRWRWQSQCPSARTGSRRAPANDPSTAAAAAAATAAEAAAAAPLYFAHRERRDRRRDFPLSLFLLEARVLCVYIAAGYICARAERN